MDNEATPTRYSWSNISDSLNGVGAVYDNSIEEELQKWFDLAQ